MTTQYQDTSSQFLSSSVKKVGKAPVFHSIPSFVSSDIPKESSSIFNHELTQESFLKSIEKQKSCCFDAVKRDNGQIYH